VPATNHPWHPRSLRCQGPAPKPLQSRGHQGTQRTDRARPVSFSSSLYFLRFMSRRHAAEKRRFIPIPSSTAVWLEWLDARLMKHEQQVHPAQAHSSRMPLGLINDRTGTDPTWVFETAAQRTVPGGSAGKAGRGGMAPPIQWHVRVRQGRGTAYGPAVGLVIFSTKARNGRSIVRNWRANCGCRQRSRQRGSANGRTHTMVKRTKAFRPLTALERGNTSWVRDQQLAFKPVTVQPHFFIVIYLGRPSRGPRLPLRSRQKYRHAATV